MRLWSVIPALALVGPALALAAPEPSYDRVHATRLACERIAKCGCPEEKCHENLLSAAQLPVASFRCVADMACADICEKAPEGQPGKASQQCFDPKLWKSLEQKYPPAPPVTPERHSTIVRACTHVAQCGCAEEECVLNLRAAGQLPLAAFSCLAGLECPKVCAKVEEFTQSPVYQACFDPKGWKALEVTEKAGEIARFCEKKKTCGCEEAQCVEGYTTNTSAFGQDLLTCFADLPCGALCEPNAMQAGSQAHLGCIKPIMDRSKAQAATDLARMQSQHRTNMSIIRAMGGSGSRVRIYDANGTYLRTELR